MKSRELEAISRSLKIIGQPARLQILLTIGDGEACVCHLEAHLGMRQAYISQHLMALRRAKVLASRREGRFVFYRLRDGRFLDLIEQTAEILGVKPLEGESALAPDAAANCCCPHCDTGVLETQSLSA